MISTLHPETTAHGMQHSEQAPPVAIPPGHVGEFVIPGTGKRIWWTGRVAIGLLHQPVRHQDQPTQSSLWIQSLLTARTRGAMSLMSLMSRAVAG